MVEIRLDKGIPHVDGEDFDENLFVSEIVPDQNMAEFFPVSAFLLQAAGSFRIIRAKIQEPASIFPGTYRNSVQKKAIIP